MVNLNKIYYGYFYSFQVWEVLVDTVQGGRYSLPTASSCESRTNVATIFLYKLSANVDLIII